MSPIGEPLHTVEPADEFATVMCDAMHYHDAIVQHCRILHRDISKNNVLVVRRNGIARGFLIDFDCAIDTNGGTSTSKRPEMTGTLPFMSINNLRNSDVQCTALDDWESMLCLERVKERVVISETLLDTINGFWKDGLAAQTAAKAVSEEQVDDRPVKRGRRATAVAPKRAAKTGGKK